MAEVVVGYNWASLSSKSGLGVEGLSRSPRGSCSFEYVFRVRAYVDARAFFILLQVLRTAELFASFKVY